VKKLKELQSHNALLFLPASCVADLFHSSDEFVCVWEHRFLEALIVWHGHVFLGYADDGSVERIKNVFLDPVANLCANTAKWMILFDDHHAMGFRDRIENCLLIERLNRTQIDNLRRDIFFLQLDCNVEGQWNGLCITNDRNIAAFAFHLCFPEWDEQLLIRRLHHSL